MTSWFGARVRLGVGVRGSDRRRGSASGSASRFGLALWFGVEVRLGVGVTCRGLASGSASRFGSASWFDVRVCLGVGVWCLWGCSGFDGCVLLGLSPWGDSGSMARSSWDILEVFVLFFSSGRSGLGLFGLLGVR